MTIQSNSNFIDIPMPDAIEVSLYHQASPLSPLMPSDKPSLDVSPVSPTSTADVFLILDESLGSPQLSLRPKSDPSLLDNSTPHFVNGDDDISLCCSEDEEMEAEEDELLLGLSFVMEEDNGDQLSSSEMED